MSRKVETDFEFDKDKFAKLLQKAKGELMLKSFAEKCDVSVGYMCKCFNAKLNHPLTPATLKKNFNLFRRARSFIQRTFKCLRV